MGLLLLILWEKMTVREYDEELYANKLDNLHEMHKFLEIHNPVSLNYEYKA